MEAKVLIADVERDTDQPLTFWTAHEPGDVSHAVAAGPRLVRLHNALRDGDSDPPYSGPLEEAPDGTYTFNLGAKKWVSITKSGRLFWVR